MPPVQKVNNKATVNAVVLSPLARTIRTIIQVVLAVGASIPIILNTTGLTGAQVTKVETIIATAVAVISVVQNTLEHYGVLPVAGGKSTPLAVPEAGR